MEKYYEDINPNSELSSDLEWMLQSGQVSNSLLIENLVRTYYAPVKRLAISILEDEAAARRVVSETFTAAMVDKHKIQGGEEIDTWIYRHAWQACRRSYRAENRWRQVENLLRIPGQLSERIAEVTDSIQDKEIWQHVDRLPTRERIPLILHLVHGWPYERMAAILGRSETDLEARVKHSLALIAGVDVADEGTLDLARANVSNSLQSRWPYSQITEERLVELAYTVEKSSQRGKLMQGSYATFKELALLLIAMIVLILAIWGGSRYFLEDKQPAGSYQSLWAFLGADDLQNIEAEAPEISQAPKRKVTLLPDATPTPTSIPTPTPEGVYYIVEQDDTLLEIADKSGVNSVDLRTINRIPAGAQLYPRQKLVIPGRLPTASAAVWTPVASYDRILNPDVAPNQDQLIETMRSMYFNTVWIDAQILTYPDESFERPTEMHRIQAWVSQDRFLLVGGPWGKPPSEVMLSDAEEIFVARPGLENSWFEAQPSWGETSPIDVRLLFSMVNLLISNRRIDRHAYQILGEGQVAGREVWVVNEADEDQIRRATLWVDKTRGMVLRSRQHHWNSGPQRADVRLPQETIVLAVEFDIDFPPDLFSVDLPWRGGYAADASGAPAESDALPPIVGDSLAQILDNTDSPPPGYAAARGRLSFRFPVRFDFEHAIAETEILADGYPIGTYDLGVPWNLNCSRSMNGRWLVFSAPNGSGDDPFEMGSPPFYLDLAKPQNLYDAADGNLSKGGSSFAIAPNGSRLAYWGCDEAPGECGVFIEDMQNHEYEMLVPLAYGAAYFVWSPEGDALAMLGANNSFFIVNTETAEVTYKGAYEPVMRAVPPDAPVYTWDVPFPPRLGGLDTCIESHQLSDARG